MASGEYTENEISKFLYRAEGEILKVFCLNVEKDSIAAISLPPPPPPPLPPSPPPPPPLQSQVPDLTTHQFQTIFCG
jgi:hypothetical protein